MKEWSSGHRQEFLEEFIRLEGRGDAHLVTRCTCGAGGERAEEGPLYRCDDCAGFLMECRTCCVARHQRLPFHLIKVRY